MRLRSRTRIATAFALIITAAGTSGAAPVPPGGKNTVTFPTSNNSVAFVAPGHRVDVCAAVRVGNKLEALLLLVDVQVTALETNSKTDVVTVTVSLTDKQAKVVALAKQRGCAFEVMARHNGAAAGALDLDTVIKTLSAVEVAPAPRPVNRVPKKDTLSLPDGHDLISLRIGRVPAFVVPAARVDVVATERTGQKIAPVLILSDKLVLSVDRIGCATKNGTDAVANTIAVAADELEVQAAVLAARGGYRLEPVLRAPDQKVSPAHDLSAVLRKLSAREVALAPRPVERR